MFSVLEEKKIRDLNIEWQKSLLCELQVTWTLLAKANTVLLSINLSEWIPSETNWHSRLSPDIL